MTFNLDGARERFFTTEELKDILNRLHDKDINTYYITLCAAHTGASMLLSNGFDPVTVQSIMGWSTLKMLEGLCRGGRMNRHLKAQVILT